MRTDHAVQIALRSQGRAIAGAKVRSMEFVLAVCFLAVPAAGLLIDRIYRRKHPEPPDTRTRQERRGDEYEVWNAHR